MVLVYISPCIVVNVGLGTYLLSDGASSIFSVYIGYVIFMAILFALLYLIFTVSALFNKKGSNVTLTAQCNTAVFFS